MRLGRSAPAVAVLAALAAVACLPAAGASAAGAPCSLATAERLVTQQRLGNGGFEPHPVAQVLCGAFLGAGSRAMVVSLSTPGCGLSIGWAVYRASGSGWKRVFLTSAGAFLAKAGSRIRTWQGVLAPNDAHCFPSSYRSRDWRWNGNRLVAGAWHRSGPPPNPLPGAASRG
jgi:hypothetical protein